MGLADMFAIAGQSLNTGVNSFKNSYDQEKERQRLFAQQNYERQRQEQQDERQGRADALGQAQGLQGLAGGMMAAGNYQGAMGLQGQYVENVNKGLGTNLSGMAFNGDPNSNPQTQRGLYGAFGLSQPKPDWTEVSGGSSLYSRGADGKAVLQATAPISANPNAMDMDDRVALANLRYQQQANLQNDRQGFQGQQQDSRQTFQQGQQQQRIGAVDAQNFGFVTQDFAKRFPGVPVTSTQRSVGHNAKVGGAPNSQHISGTAMDIVPPVAMEPAVRQWAASQGLQIIEEGAGTPNYHWHLQVPGGARPVKPTRGAAAPRQPAGQQFVAPDGTLVAVRPGEKIPQGAVKPSQYGKPVAAPKAPAPLDETKARNLARDRAGIKRDRPITPRNRDAFEAELAKVKAEHAAQSRAATGQKSKLQQLLEMN